MYKVLFVDDEIMAMRYLKNQFEWEENGFEIVSMETNPLKALSLLEGKKIDIAFVDIRMPGMDGLSFAEKALNIRQRLKVIILTSFEDFEYAQQSIHVGVTKYLLKHGLTKELLSTELENVKRKIVEEQKQGMIVVAGILKKVVKFDMVLMEKEQQQIRTYLDIQNKHMACFLVVLDVTIINSNYSILQTYSKKNEGILNQFIEVLDDPRILTIDVGEGTWLVLDIFEQTVSQKEICEEVYTVAYRIQRYVCRNYKDRTVSIIPSRVFNDINELHTIYQQLKEYVKYLIFYGKNKVIDMHELAHRKTISKGRVEQSIKTISESLKRDNNDQIIFEIDRIFGICTAAMDAESLLSFLHEIQFLIEDYARKYCLQRAMDESSNQYEVYSVEQLHSYIGSQFEMMIAEKSISDFSHIPERMRKGIQYIHENYAQEIHIEDVAEHVGVSGEYLRHLFKADMKESFTEYLTRLRVEKAKKLLLEKRYRLYEIANMVGYNSGNYFSNTFKRVTGMKPQEYGEECNEDKKRN